MSSHLKKTGSLFVQKKVENVLTAIGVFYESNKQITINDNYKIMPFVFPYCSKSLQSF